MRPRSLNNSVERESLIGDRLDSTLESIIMLCSMNDVAIERKKHFLKNLCFDKFTSRNKPFLPLHQDLSEIISKAQDKTITAIQQGVFGNSCSIEIRIWKIFSELVRDFSEFIGNKDFYSKYCCSRNSLPEKRKLEKRYSFARHKIKTLEYENVKIKKEKTFNGIDRESDFRMLQVENKKLNESLEHLSYQLEDIRGIKPIRSSNSQEVKTNDDGIYEKKDDQKEYCENLEKELKLTKEKLLETERLFVELEAEKILISDDKQLLETRVRIEEEEKRKIIEKELTNTKNLYEDLQKLKNISKRSLYSKIGDLKEELNKLKSFQLSCFSELTELIQEKHSKFKYIGACLAGHTKQLNKDLSFVKDEFVTEQRNMMEIISAIKQKMTDFVLLPKESNDLSLKKELKLMKDINDLKKLSFDQQEEINAKSEEIRNLEQSNHGIVREKETIINELRKLVSDLQKECQEKSQKQEILSAELSKAKEDLEKCCLYINDKQEEIEIFSAQISELSTILSDKDIELTLSNEQLNSYLSMIQELNALIPDKFKQPSILDSLKSLINHFNKTK